MKCFYTHKKDQSIIMISNNVYETHTTVATMEFTFIIIYFSHVSHIQLVILYYAVIGIVDITYLQYQRSKLSIPLSGEVISV